MKDWQAWAVLEKLIDFVDMHDIVNTGDFGKVLGVSQQTGSRYLTELERRGWIKREYIWKGFIVEVVRA